MEAKIEYPCKWEYRIIGEDEDKIRDFVFELLDKQYGLERKNASSNGKYISLHLIVEVDNEEERNLIFQKLLNFEAIKMVI